MTTTRVLVARLLRRGLPGTVALLGGIAVLEALVPWIAHTLITGTDFNSFLASLPPQMQAMARINPDLIKTMGARGFLPVGYTDPLFLVLTAAIVIGFAARGLAGEIGGGTLALTLARPVSRQHAYLARVIALLVLCAAVGVAGAIGTIVGVTLALPAGIISTANIAWLWVTVAALAWAFGGLTLGASSAASSTGRVIGWAIGVLAVCYFVDYFANVWSVLKRIQPFSILAYYDPSKALVYATVDRSDLAVLLLLGLAGVAVGIVIFDRRDLLL